MTFNVAKNLTSFEFLKLETSLQALASNSFLADSISISLHFLQQMLRTKLLVEKASDNQKEATNLQKDMINKIKIQIQIVQQNNAEENCKFKNTYYH